MEYSDRKYNFSFPHFWRFRGLQNCLPTHTNIKILLSLICVRSSNVTLQRCHTLSPSRLSDTLDPDKQNIHNVSVRSRLTLLPVWGCQGGRPGRTVGGPCASDGHSPAHAVSPLPPAPSPQLRSKRSPDARGPWHNYNMYLTVYYSDVTDLWNEFLYYYFLLRYN